MSFGAKAESRESSGKSSVFFNYIKGIVVAIISSLLLVVVFALFVKWFTLSDRVIVPVTMCIKGVSVALGAIFAVRGESRGLIKGVAFGAIYISISFLLFGLLSGSLSFGLSNLLDLVCVCALGGVVGIVKVNKRH